MADRRSWRMAVAVWCTLLVWIEEFMSGIFGEVRCVVLFHRGCQKRFSTRIQDILDLTTLRIHSQNVTSYTENLSREDGTDKSLINGYLYTRDYLLVK